MGIIVVFDAGKWGDGVNFNDRKKAMSSLHILISWRKMSTVWNSTRGTLFWANPLSDRDGFQENKLNSELGPRGQSLQIYPKALLQ